MEINNLVEELQSWQVCFSSHPHPLRGTGPVVRMLDV